MTAIPVLWLIILGFIIFIIIKQMINSNPKRLKKADEDYISNHVKQFVNKQTKNDSDTTSNADNISDSNDNA